MYTSRAATESCLLGIAGRGQQKTLKLVVVGASVNEIIKVASPHGGFDRHPVLQVTVCKLECP